VRSFNCGIILVVLVVVVTIIIIIIIIIHEFHHDTSLEQNFRADVTLVCNTLQNKNLAEVLCSWQTHMSLVCF